MQKERINAFLVDAFNTILQVEERALGSDGPHANLSVREYHVIEAVIACGDDATMSAVAKRLHITIGSLTVAVKTLEKKGYLLREKRTGDRRMVFVAPTEPGRSANDYHAAFHRQMVDAVMDKLPESELETLVSALGIVAGFFANSEWNAD